MQCFSLVADIVLNWLIAKKCKFRFGNVFLNVKLKKQTCICAKCRNLEAIGRSHVMLNSRKCRVSSVREDDCTVCHEYPEYLHSKTVDIRTAAIMFVHNVYSLKVMNNIKFQNKAATCLGNVGAG